jgi:hypothetical protein
MTGFLLVYERYENLSAEHSWKPLLQHQALLAVSRAILADERSEAPALSAHELFVPRNLDVLPLLALIARDFASFAEPEGDDRGRTPLLLYEDGSGDLDSEDMAEMQHLLHPAWFHDLNLTLADVMKRRQPQVCVIIGDPIQAARRLIQFRDQFRIVVQFEQLTTGDAADLALFFPRVVAADRILQQAMDARRGEREREPTRSVWSTMFREDEAVELEPFVAFGPALEMAVLADEGERGGAL